MLPGDSLLNPSAGNRTLSFTFLDCESLCGRIVSGRHSASHPEDLSAPKEAARLHFLKPRGQR
jgi:hypothetical protein